MACSDQDHETQCNTENWRSGAALLAKNLIVMTTVLMQSAFFCGEQVLSKGSANPFALTLNPY